MGAVWVWEKVAPVGSAALLVLTTLTARDGVTEVQLTRQPPQSTVQPGAAGVSTVDVDVPVVVSAGVVVDAAVTVMVSLRLAELVFGAVPANWQVTDSPGVRTVVLATGPPALVQVTGAEALLPTTSLIEVMVSRTRELLVMTAW